MGTPQKIENFKVSFNLTPAAYPGLAVSSPIISQIGIASIQNPIVASGVYTPNNDYLYLAQNIPHDKSPNFFFLMCAGQLNITVANAQGYAIAALPIFKQWLCFLPSPNTYPINGIYIEGRTGNVPMPMPQGQPIEYFFLMGQAQIT